MNKKIKRFLIPMLLSLPFLSLVSCGNNTNYVNPGDNLDGGGEADDIPDFADESSVSSILEVTDGIASSSVSLSVPEDAIVINAATDISVDGNYVLSGAIDLGDSQIKVNKNLTNVVLYFNGVTITKSTDKKAINAKSTITIVVVEGTSNSVSVSYADCDAIGSDYNLNILGKGTLNVTGTDDGINASGVLFIDGPTLNVNATNGSCLSADTVIVRNTNGTLTSVDKDGIHAESDYDNLEAAPEFSFGVGYVYLKGNNLTITTTGTGDGIQADSFIQTVSGTYIIKTNGGCPTSITNSSSDNADGKALKAGTIDWGVSDTEVVSDNYTIYIQGGTFEINSNDDAIHSNGYCFIEGGTFNIAAGDDGIHADDLLKISSGSVTISKSYEGIESAKIEILGGTFEVNSKDDGINAADGTTTQMGNSNSNCHIIISGGEIVVDAEGDGVDSNGTILITGGALFVNGPTGSGDGSLDSEGGIIVNGGTLFAVGSLGMVETPTTTSSQYIVSFATSSNISAGTTLSLVDSSGETLCYMTTTKVCRSVIISCSELVLNSTYQIFGGTQSLVSFTVTSKITTIGSTNTGGGPGGGGHGH